MTLVMGRREPHVLARACDLGVAMQLTNIARDIGEDAGNGRIYMPLDWLGEAGIGTGDWLAARHSTARMRSLVSRLLREAETLYDRSLCGIAALPTGCRLGISTARLLYREIGREIQRGIDPVSSRAVTSRQKKMRLVIEAMATRATTGAGISAPAVPQAQFLIDAVSGLPSPRIPDPLPAWWDVKARSERMMDLLHGFSARSAARDAAVARPAFTRPGLFPRPDP